MSALSWQVESTWKLRDLDVLRLQRKQRRLLFERVLYMLVLMLQVREERPGDWNFIILLILEDCPVLGVPGRAVLYCNFSILFLFSYCWFWFRLLAGRGHQTIVPASKRTPRLVHPCWSVWECLWAHAAMIHAWHLPLMLETSWGAAPTQAKATSTTCVSAL